MLIQPLTPEILEKRRNFRRKLLGLPGRFWRKTRRGILWTLAIGFVAHSALNIYASVLLNRELSTIRQKGEPLTFAEMAPPDVPDAQNAALLYQVAFDAMRASRAEEVTVSTRQSQRTPQQKREVEAILGRNQRALDLARRAAAMPKCRFPLDYSTKNPTGLLFPYYGKMRQIARSLGAQAELNAQKGDMDAALRDVRAIFGMAHHLSNEPVLIGFLVAQAVDSLAHQALARVLESAPLNLAQARAFENSLPATDWNRAFFRCLTGERAYGIFAFETVRQARSGNFLADYGINPAPIWASYPLAWLWNPFLKLDQVQTLRIWQQNLAAASAPPFSPQARFNDRIIENTPRYALLTRILMPIFGSVSINRDRAEVRQRQRQIALALALYRARNGAYPTEISPLPIVWKKPLPLDPYAQKPFIYRRDAQGFRLYSIGPNRRDEGGLKLQEQFPLRGADFSDDIIWGGPYL